MLNAVMLIELVNTDRQVAGLRLICFKNHVKSKRRSDFLSKLKSLEMSTVCSISEICSPTEFCFINYVGTDTNEMIESLGLRRLVFNTEIVQVSGTSIISITGKEFDKDSITYTYMKKKLFLECLHSLHWGICINRQVFHPQSNLFVDIVSDSCIYWYLGNNPLFIWSPKLQKFKDVRELTFQNCGNALCYSYVEEIYILPRGSLRHKAVQIREDIIINSNGKVTKEICYVEGNNFYHKCYMFSLKLKMWLLIKEVETIEIDGYKRRKVS